MHDLVILTCYLTNTEVHVHVHDQPARQEGKSLRACLHGGGGLQVGELTCGGSPHLSCKRDQIEMRDYMDRWVTPSKRVTSPTWDPPPPCKHALSKKRQKCVLCLQVLNLRT